MPAEQKTPPEKLLELRNKLRSEKKFNEADAIRDQLSTLGFSIEDTPSGSHLISNRAELKPVEKNDLKRLGKVALFGSGELSATGRRVHEILIEKIPPPVVIGLVETAAGFEQNPHKWYTKLKEMMVEGLQNSQPKIDLIDALRLDGDKSTNNPALVQRVAQSHYLHLGAGSPTYAVRHLKDTLLLTEIEKHIQQGYPLSLASAASVAFGEFVLPVYEIYKAGFDLYWENGLNFFKQYGFSATIIPHFNNEEGGHDIDTSHCFMGKDRFEKLLKMLPANSKVIGIDEQTACIIDLETMKAEVMGVGNVTLLFKKTKEIYKAGQKFNLL